MKTVCRLETETVREIYLQTPFKTDSNCSVPKSTKAPFVKGDLGIIRKSGAKGVFFRLLNRHQTHIETMPLKGALKW